MQFDGELGFFLAKQTNTYVEFVKKDRIPIFAGSKPIFMKRVLVVVVLLGFLTSCSQYTCPTYSKKEVKKSNVRRI